MFESVLGWFDLSRILSIVGVFIALTSLFISWQNRALTLKQESRRQPRLLPTLLQAFYKSEGEGTGRTYALEITVANPTDNNNAIAGAELSISYRKTDGVQMTMKLRANEPKVTKFVEGQGEMLSVPAPVNAHGAASGWLYFHVPSAMLAGRDIDTYRLALTDPHGEIVGLVPILIQEFRNA